MSLLDVAARSTDIENGLNVGVHKPSRTRISNRLLDPQLQEDVLLELIAVRINLELAAVVVTLQSDQVSEAPDRATIVLPI